jgi:hypothetical protein
VDERRSRPVRPAVRSALALVTAFVAVTGAWQVASASTTPAAASSARGVLKARHHHAVATEADSMKSVTLRRGDTLTVTLHGGWSAPRSQDPAVLRQAMPAVLGSVTFVASAAGTTSVEATRSPVCTPGRMCAMYVQIYTLSVTVH